MRGNTLDYRMEQSASTRERDALGSKCDLLALRCLRNALYGNILYHRLEIHQSAPVREAFSGV
jgi:hypothetical protein